MASHKSAEKSIRKAARQREINTNRVSRMRTFIKKVELAIRGKQDRDCILSAFSDAQSEIMKGVGACCIHKNAASRKISRISKKVKLAIGEMRPV